MDIKNLKVAILVRGLHYFEDYKSPLKHIGVKQIDYRNCLDNFRKYLLSPLKYADIFLTTYNTSLNEELIKDFSPVNSVFKEFPGIINDTPKRNYEIVSIIKNGLALIPDEYDVYIITRFDLLYKMNVLDWNIQPNCLNITSRVNHNNSDDNIFVFTRDQLPFFKNALNRISNRGYNCNRSYNKTSKNPAHLMHCMNFFYTFANRPKRVIVRYMVEGIWTPHTSPIYTIEGGLGIVTKK